MDEEELSSLTSELPSAHSPKPPGPYAQGQPCSVYEDSAISSGEEFNEC